MMLPMVCWVIALLFFIMGFTASRSKKPAGIYSNIKAPEKEKITDLKAYNKAVGKLLAGYGMLQVVTGYLLFDTKGKGMELLLIFSFFFGAILMMILYEIIIAPKYIKK